MLSYKTAANQIERFNILDREFERVNADNINAYDAAFVDFSGYADKDEMQNEIDNTNAEEAMQL